MLIFVEANTNGDQWYSRILNLNEFRQFVTAALAGERHKKAWVGTVTPQSAARIRAICGKTVSKIMVESDAVWHSCKKSAHNLEPDDIFHIVDVINTADYIQKSEKGNQNNAVLKFNKDINGTITFVEEVRVNFEGWLALVTCYRLKKVR